MIDLPPDPLDRAADLTERERAAIIAGIVSKAKLPETGRCLWCSEPVQVGSFCPGGECRDDYNKAQRFKGR